MQNKYGSDIRLDFSCAKLPIVTDKSMQTRVNTNVYLPRVYRVAIFTPSTDKLHKTRAPTRKFIAGLRAVVCRRGNWYRSLISADVVPGKRRKGGSVWNRGCCSEEREATRSARGCRWRIVMQGVEGKRVRNTEEGE